MRMRDIMTIITEDQEDDSLIYHWIDRGKAATALKLDKLTQRKWRHFIPQAGKFLNGISFGYNEHTWSGEYYRPDDICFVVDRRKLTNLVYDINGAGAFLLSHALIQHPDDADEIISQRGEAVRTTPDEAFVVGGVPNLHLALDHIVLKPASKGTSIRAQALGYKDKFGVPIFVGAIEIE